jgi:ketosteroid isomerase-like protein
VPDTDALIAEVLAAEAAWTEAHRTTDTAAIDGLMHRDYVIVSPSGRAIPRAEALASYVPGERQWDFAESDEHDVRIYGDTAVVIGRWRARGVNNGVAFDYAARYVSVWVKEEGRWQMVADSSTEIKA